MNTFHILLRQVGISLACYKASIDTGQHQKLQTSLIDQDIFICSIRHYTVLIKINVNIRDKIVMDVNSISIAIELKIFKLADNV